MRETATFLPIRFLGSTASVSPTTFSPNSLGDMISYHCFLIAMFKIQLSCNFDIPNNLKLFADIHPFLARKVCINPKEHGILQTFKSFIISYKEIISCSNSVGSFKKVRKRPRQSFLWHLQKGFWQDPGGVPTSRRL